MMRLRNSAALALAVLAIAAGASERAAGAPDKAAAEKAEKKADEKKADEPFYRRFLAPGNPLDDRILEMEKAVEASPDSAALRNDFGNLLAARRLPGEARVQYRIAMKLDKKSFLAPYNLGIVYETEGKTGAAMSAYEKAIDRNRGFPPARFRLGRLYERAGRSEAAVVQYARAIEIDPAMRDVRRNPLVADTRLLDRVSLRNYEIDLARASVATELEFADPRFAHVPVDRPISTSDLVDPSEPEPVDAARPTTPRQPVAMPPGAREIRPQDLSGRPAPPPPSPVPVTPAPPAGPSQVAPGQPAPMPEDNPFGLRPSSFPTPLPQPNTPQ